MLSRARSADNGADDALALAGRLLTADEVAGYLRISRAMAYKLIAQGHLRHIKIARCIRVAAADVALFIQSHTSEGTVHVPAYKKTHF